MPDGNWKLQVSGDGRSLVKADGSPWFWLGDTAWDLFIRPTREDLREYFRNRQAKGFTVIQGVLLMGLHVDFNAPNVYGHKPLVDDDPRRPDLRARENFWTHADHVVDTAREYGLYIGLLPVWGWSHVAGHANYPVMLNRESAEEYFSWVAARYKDQPNIIWINGGDAAGDEHGETDVELWRAAGRALKRVDPEHLVTFHPRGRHSSARLFHDDSWLDFNMIQSGHGQVGLHNDDMIDDAYRRSPAKPVLEGEPRYESHPVNWKPINGFFNDYDVRQAAYWSLFAGSFGHTYGHVNTWRFAVPGAPKFKERFEMMDLHWKATVDFPGAVQMTHVRNLMLSRPPCGRRPCQSLLAANEEGEAGLRATLGDGYAFVYTPYGHPVRVARHVLLWSDSTAWWFDPRTAAAWPASGTVDEKALTYVPPGKPYRSNDWVLVIDDSARGFRPPGEPQMISR